jgi:hypothetical protein
MLSTPSTVGWHSGQSANSSPSVPTWVPAARSQLVWCPEGGPIPGADTCRHAQETGPAEVKAHRWGIAAIANYAVRGSDSGGRAALAAFTPGPSPSPDHRRTLMRASANRECRASSAAATPHPRPGRNLVRRWLAARPHEYQEAKRSSPERTAPAIAGLRNVRTGKARQSALPCTPRRSQARTDHTSLSSPAPCRSAAGQVPAPLHHFDC